MRTVYHKITQLMLQGRRLSQTQETAAPTGPWFHGLLALLKDKAIIVMIFQNAGNVFAYLFQIGLAQVLSTEDFGSFNALFALSLLFTAPAIAVQLLVSKAVIELSKEQQPERLRILLWIASCATLGVTLSMVFALYFVSDQIAVSNAGQLWMTGAIVGSQFLASVLAGTIQGLRLYTSFGIATGLIPLMRFVLLILAVLAIGMSNTIALGLCVLSNLVSAIYCISLLPRTSTPKATVSVTMQWLWTSLFKGTGGASMFLGSGFIMFFSNIDIILVRVFCTELQSGLYAASALIGRIVFLVPMALAQVLFSESVYDNAQGQSPLPRLMRSLLMTTLIAGPIVLACWIAPESLVRILVGSRYIEAQAYLPWTALAMMSLTLANIVLMFLIPTHSMRYLWIFVGIAVTLVLSVSAFHDTPKQIAAQLSAATTILFIGLILYLRRTAAARGL